ncbi:hypothetical protein PHISCL_04788 [Aspergillus sclerotialis]|uniref:Uncharacterized protein n=1 Tax=Aspergillus sclerotialis TaxID=2070753 RepID=A0A3A2ZIF2_9EURO|nr:hypothetical protein PHISCL_04788 [Aspergillus sclerotialis]
MPKKNKKTTEAGPRVKSENLSTSLDNTSTATSSKETPHRHDLTRDALRELNRQNKANQPVPASPPLLSPPPITNEKHLKRFARLGGPSLTDIRGYPRPPRDAEANTILEDACPGNTQALFRTAYPCPENQRKAKIISEAKLEPLDPNFPPALTPNAAHPGVSREPNESIKPCSQLVIERLEREMNIQK